MPKIKFKDYFIFSPRSKFYPFEDGKIKDDSIDTIENFLQNEENAKLDEESFQKAKVQSQMNFIQPIENVNFDSAEVNQLIFAVKMYLLRFQRS